MIAPAMGQVMLLAMLMSEGRWMFAWLIVPGIIGCAASALAMMLSQRRASRDSHNPGGTGSDGPSNEVGTATAFPAVDLPSVSLDALLDLESRNPADLWRLISRQWHAAGESSTLRQSSSSISAVVGMGERGRYRIDLSRSGPHALVAGTTGSGKSVLLETWCLSLACRMSPDMLNFVFLDFKGGSSFRILHRLPHTVGFVSDLDISHAVRALRAIEAELKRREHLAADHHAASISELDSPPPRLMVVIDEFHALRNQLPDYIDRLVSLAALGRSLGMHLVVCTQNPMGQVTTDMKANIGLNICLRVRDSLQSTELIGDQRAALISSQKPGLAYAFDGDDCLAFRCAVPESSQALVTGCLRAARFMGIEPIAPLFSAPLPRTIPPDHPLLRDAVPELNHPRGTGDHIPRTITIGLEDTGVRLRPCRLPLDQGNIAIVGSDGRGKSTLLAVIAKSLAKRSNIDIIVTRRTESDRHDLSLPTDQTACGRIWLADDADALLDPMSADALGQRFRAALHDPRCLVVFTLASSRYLRFPEHCGVRLIFPTGDRAIDMMAGIPSSLLSGLTDADVSTAGRFVMLARGHSAVIQCIQGDPKDDPIGQTGI
ncbi:DNA segregation ATPase and related proteins (FtsK/SpoIIIE family) [Bifidobacterium margollesii]|uniref:DNA segregation ATPase and related proteins (FtsK/SpoIIIE family) n=1 Tax=Bifidobacterium margollesii TaxID=2020964 RepID=A0A2N5J999_9BIFI|nr:FtsK/SpoIIIE domain-containing protein [Bifidobacterium margollesii]PLS30784.1 DNA segregation ATPase and related proteins (FtsK/SpoIIIE family) [Bifidobacterium margollesii]